MRALAALAAGLLLALAPLPAAAEDGAAPKKVVRETADEILGILGQKQLPVEERRRRIEAVAHRAFDVETISRLILARHWRRFSPAQREEFVFEFKRYIAANYGDRLDGYEDEKVEIVGGRPEARGDYTVRTRIVGQGFEPVSVDYRLRQRDANWMLIDVVIEGVSFLKSFRSQFQEILSRGGPEVLLKQLREKNEAAEARSAEKDSDLSAG